MLDAAFVFVVCGTKEHIDTLRFSHAALKARTQLPIYIITDPNRNEEPIDLENCIDVEVESKYDNHQASIFLKTSLHRYLPVHEKYCYLDTDVIACGAHPDEIFNEYIAPIRFALDHCTIQKFSPTAIHCNCSKNKTKEQFVWHEFMKEIKVYEPYHKKLNAAIDFEKRSISRRLLLGMKYFSSYPKFRLNEEFLLDKPKKEWYHKDIGDLKTNVRKFRGKDGIEIYYNKKRNKWTNQFGQDIWDDSCRCLENQIRADLNINVANENWHHWNGGVFLFSQNSASFLENWHNLTLYIFTLPNWKTRDQGSLIATVWKHELQDRIPLDTKWNFLADANNEAVVFNEDGIGSIDGGRHTFKTEFAHIYHRFGDATWSIWQNVDKLLNNG